MTNKIYFNVFKNLIHADLLEFKDVVVGKIIDMGIWIGLTLLVMQYIMPYFGLAADFGAIQLGGAIASAGLFELNGSVINFVSDMEGNKIINYHLTLPMPSWLVFVSKTAYYIIIYIALSVCMLPFAKLVLWTQWDLSTISYYKLALAIFSACTFYATFTLWCSAIIKDMQSLNQVWARYIFPMWFMGGFQFSWFSLLKALPIVAYISLINPMIYITEAMRVALLGQENYINFWICIIVINAFSLACALIGIYNLRKRLDYV